MINSRGLVALVPALCLSAAVWAGDKIPEDLSDRLKTLVPSMAPDSVKASPVEGMYEVVYGGDVLYLSADGNFLMQGMLVDLENNVNLTDRTKNAQRKVVLDSISDDQTIMYKPKGETKHTITVFTDVDCPYCRLMHEEMDGYLAAGIAVRYMLYPRAGYGTSASDKLVTAWCAEDRAEALTAAKMGKGGPTKLCDNPVEEHISLGQKVGVSGTPAILLENGQLVPGFRPPKDMAVLLSRLEVSKK